ncbi:aminotransferase class I/II-fold pyridoxal phosphate-dependent enzyme [Naumannella huperziae]
MPRLSELSENERAEFRAEQERAYAALQQAGLKLDLTRGKPAATQLDLSNELLELPGGKGIADDGTDTRNYGGQLGLTELRAIFAELLGVELDQVIAQDNSSLSLMHDLIAYAMLHGIGGGQRWAEQKIKFICPVPGYDRHFGICQHLGIEMVPVELGPHGPDVEAVRELAADPAVKGIWVVPMYANPSGAIYDEQTTRALLAMPAADDFRIFWDNAYAFHHLTAEEYAPLDVLGMAAEAGNPDRVYQFASTSKITFAGAGVSFLASSKANLDEYVGHAKFRSIGPDKVNHLRHVRFFGDAEGVRRLMREHRDQLAPKFDLVGQVLTERLGPHGVGEWEAPDGGYFVNLAVPDGTATRVVELAKQAGIALTPAGAAYPHGNDPRDRHIRIAPTFPPLPELEQAINGLATCVLLAAAES